MFKKTSKLVTFLFGIMLAFVLAGAVACKTPTPPPEPEPEPTTYTVTFDANGGTLSGSATLTVKEGSKISGAPTAAKEGFTFEAWYTAASEGTAVDLATYTVSSNVTLYAHYTENVPEVITITFNANGGKLTGKASVEVNAGTVLASTSIPTASKTDFVFAGWFTAAEGGTEVDLTKAVTSTVTLYAHYTPVPTYTVTFNANGGTVTGNATLTVKEGGKVTGAPTAAKEGCDFDGWYTAAEGGDKVNLSNLKVTADVTLYAHYTEKPVATTPSMAITKLTGGYRIEAEDAKIDGTPSSDSTFIETPANTSGGKSIGYLNVAGNTVTFTFKSAAAGKATLMLLGASNNVKMDESKKMWVEDQEIDDKVITVKFNDKAVTYDVQTIRGAGEEEPMTWNKYFDPINFGELDVVAGDNVLVITVVNLPPNIDCLDVVTTLTLSSVDGTAATQGEGSVTPVPAKPAKAQPVYKIEGGYMLEAEESQIVGDKPGFGDYIETGIEAASGKSSVGSFYGGGMLTFTFNAATAGKATIKTYHSKNGEDAQFSSETFKITLNGKTLTFEGQTVRGSGDNYNDYFDPVVVGTELDLVAGVNTITYGNPDSSVEGEFFGVTFWSPNAPNIDRIEIITDVVLSPATPTGSVVEEVKLLEADATAKVIVGAYPGGPAIEKIVYGFEVDLTAEQIAGLKLTAKIGSSTIGAANTNKVYLSDKDGKALAAGVESSKFVTVEFVVAYSGWGFGGNVSPFTYANSRNSWNKIDETTVKVELEGTLALGEEEYNKFAITVTSVERVIPSVDGIWDVTGTHTYGEGDAAQTLHYASYGTDAMKNDGVKNALIIWLHGAGEGGTDPTINILGNQVTTLSQELIQKYFIVEGGTQGAYVLAPQSPTMWMDQGEGEYATDYKTAKSIYEDALWDLITKFVTANPDIDTNRIYIGGCSNGGYMTMHMLDLHPTYFAAAYPVCTPYYSDADLAAKLKDMPIWFTHAKNDTTVAIAEWVTEGKSQTFDGYAKQNTNALYIDLLAAGATNVHYTLWEDVKYEEVDYMGHYSWIWTLLDLSKNVQKTTGADGAAFGLSDLNEKSTETVKIDGEDVTIWGWLAAQSKAPTAE